jgi:hypothetical protein
MQAVQGMSIINNRVGIMGDLALAMVEASGLLEQKRVEYFGEGDSLECKVTLQRKSREPQIYSFSIREARTAGIYDRSPTWRNYPRRMTYYRALGFGLRDEFSDVLKGTKTLEELQDYDPPLEEQSPERRVRTTDLRRSVRNSTAKVKEPPTREEAPKASERPLLVQVRSRLEESKISEPEFLDILRAAQIPEAANATSLDGIPDKPLNLSLSAWDTVIALAEELRARETQEATS